MGTVQGVLPADLAATISEGQTVLCGPPQTDSVLRVAVVGASGAGKTTVCLRLLGRCDEVPLKTGIEPCMMPNMMARERMNLWTLPFCSGLDVELVDCGSKPEHRALWSKHWAAVAGLIFVVDGSSRSALADACEVMQSDVLRHAASARVPLLVLASDRPPPAKPLPEGLILSRLGLPWEAPAPPPGSAPPASGFAVLAVAAAVPAAAAVAAVSRRRTGVRPKWLAKALARRDSQPSPPSPRRLLFGRCRSTDDADAAAAETRSHLARLLQRIELNNRELSSDPEAATAVVMRVGTEAVGPGAEFRAGMNRSAQS